MRTLALALALTAACDSTGPRGDEFEGDYQLQTVNGKPLPAVFQTSPGNSVTFHRGHYVIFPKGSWFSYDSVTTLANGSASNSSGGELGDWIRSGNKVTFIVDNVLAPPTFIDATWNGNTLTLTRTYTFVYRR